MNKMRSQEEVERLIREIESKVNDGYDLDEGDQAALMALYWVLGDDNI